MSKQRIIKDEMWTDEWFFELDPSEKLMWVFLLTNPRNNIAGVYSCSISWIGIHTGFEKQVVELILGRFEKEGKIIREGKWIIIKNFAKHQALNPKVEAGIERILSELPEEIYSLCIGYPSSVKLSKVELSNKEEKPKKEKPLKTSSKYLLNVPDEDIKEWTTRFRVTEKQIRSKGEDLDNWRKSKGASKKDWKATLLNAIKKDFEERTEEEKSRTTTRPRLNPDGSPMINPETGGIMMETVNC